MARPEPALSVSDESASPTRTTSILEGRYAFIRAEEGDGDGDALCDPLLLPLHAAPSESVALGVGVCVA